MKTTRSIGCSISALVWGVLGVLVCFGAIRLGLGSVSEPGAGFIFFWSGLLLVLLSLLVFASSVRESDEPAQGGMNWAKIALVLLALLLYGFLLERLGFVISTFLLMSFLLGWVERTKWFKAVGVAAFAATASYAIFQLWLKIRFPRGLFGF